MFHGVLALAAVSFALPVLPLEQSPEAEPRPIEEVRVVGRRPGPPLWRASHGDNTLWIVATVEPLPRKHSWDESSIRYLIASASRFVTPPLITASTSNPFKAMDAVARLRAAKKLPQGVQLTDDLPLETNALVGALVDSYHLPLAKLQKLRPYAAADALRERVYRKNGFELESNLVTQLTRWARRNKLDISESTVHLKIDEAIELFESVPAEAGLVCLQETLTHLAYDQWPALDRADAWAEGDAAALLQLDYPQSVKACDDALVTSAVARQARAASRSLWLANAQQALAGASVSVTTLPMREIAHPEGLFAQLGAAGYEMQGQSLNQP